MLPFPFRESLPLRRRALVGFRRDHLVQQLLGLRKELHLVRARALGDGEETPDEREGHAAEGQLRRAVATARAASGAEESAA